MRLFQKLNDWYEGFKEPKRFLVFMGMMLLWLVPFYVGVLVGIKTLTIVGCLGLGFMCWWAIYRVNLFNKKD